MKVRECLSPFSREGCEAGVDEAGRGPLLGRVYAAAVVFPSDIQSREDAEWMQDSKTLTAKQKEKAVRFIHKHALFYSVSFSEVDEIDRVNILRATHNAMHRCLDDISNQATLEHVLVDGTYFLPYPGVPHTCVQDGDAKYMSVAAASILAKTARDEYVEALCCEHPDLESKYGILKNKGYGTKRHFQGLAEHGPSPWHRMSFRPCRAHAT